MSFPDIPPRRFDLAAVVLASTLAVLATAAIQGCGGGEPTFDQSLKHTPETLVEEFVTRYKNLPAHRKEAKGAKAARTKAADSPDVDEAGKSSRREAVTKGEMAKETETLENVAATLEERLGQIAGVPPAEAAAQAAALIEKSPDVKDDDKKTVLERLKKLQ